MDLRNRLLVLILLIFISLEGISQSLTIRAIESRLITHQGVEFVGELKDVGKDIYSYNTYSNDGILYLNNTQYKISNINFNVSTNSFESRVDRKKLFSYKNTNLDSVSINNHMFKKIDDYFYEVLDEKEEYYLLKKHDIKYHEGAINRMHLSQAEGYTTLEYRYLVKIEQEFKTFQLNKKSILGLLENGSDQNFLESYAKENKLSFKREKDVARLMQFLVLESEVKFI